MLTNSDTHEDAFSCPVDLAGVPVAHKPIVGKSTIIRKKLPLCFFWKHEYVFADEVAVNERKIPIAQVFECSKCMKRKYVIIDSRP